MTIKTNSGLKLFMESAIASAKTISGITKAAPGVVSSTAHGFVNNDIVLLEVQGMVELNGRLFKVVNTAADSFQLAGVDGTTGIDTTLYNTFSSGTAKKVTLGTSITGVQEFTFSGGDIKTVDSTTVNDLVDTQIVVGAAAQAADLTMQWDPSSAAQQAMIAAFQTRANKGFKVMWPDGAFVLWYGTVGYTGAPGGGKQGVTTSPAKITMLGGLTVCAA
ncbi:MAG: phage tail protein [Pseudomonas sp.]|nr:phage tail protein [Pseudomonas sp.]